MFYLTRNTPLNIPHLAAKLVQTGRIETVGGFALEDAKNLLRTRFEEIDYGQAKDDVRLFISNPATLDVWSADFFCALVDGMRA